MLQFDLARTFWSCNPQYKGFEHFNKLYKEDDSYNKTESSKLCWAAALYCSVSSECINLEETDRVQFIDASLFEKPTFARKSKLLSELITLIEKLEDSPAARMLKQWNRIMDEKNEYMATLNYRDHGKKLEDMLASNSKLITEYERICGMLAKEEVSERTRGESKESLSEQGML